MAHRVVLITIAFLASCLPAYSSNSCDQTDIPSQAEPDEYLEYIRQNVKPGDSALRLGYDSSLVYERALLDAGVRVLNIVVYGDLNLTILKEFEAINGEKVNVIHDVDLDNLDIEDTPVDVLMVSETDDENFLFTNTVGTVKTLRKAGFVDETTLVIPPCFEVSFALALAEPDVEGEHDRDDFRNAASANRTIKRVSPIVSAFLFNLNMPVARIDSRIRRASVEHRIRLYDASKWILGTMVWILPNLACTSSPWSDEPGENPIFLPASQPWYLDKNTNSARLLFATTDVDLGIAVIPPKDVLTSDVQYLDHMEILVGKEMPDNFQARELRKAFVFVRSECAKERQLFIVTGGTLETLLSVVQPGEEVLIQGMTYADRAEIRDGPKVLERKVLDFDDFHKNPLLEHWLVFKDC